MRLALAIALALGGLGCAKKDEAKAPPAGPPPLGEPAARQMRDACAAFVAHVCGCADRSPADAALAEQCQLARAIPGALELAIRGAQAEGGAAVDREGLLANVNLIQKSCVEESARLELTCPRATAAPAAL